MTAPASARALRRVFGIRCVVCNGVIDPAVADFYPEPMHMACATPPECEWSLPPFPVAAVASLAEKRKHAAELDRQAVEAAAAIYEVALTHDIFTYNNWRRVWDKAGVPEPVRARAIRYAIRHGWINLAGALPEDTYDDSTDRVKRFWSLINQRARRAAR